MSDQPLKIDFLQNEPLIGLSILPGRKNRNVTEDVQAILQANITHVMCLITEEEFPVYKVDELKNQYQLAGIQVHYLPIMDMDVPTNEEAKAAINWLKERVGQNQKTLIHCVGGLGRSGTIAACYLKEKGFPTAKAIQAIRKSRSPLAIETNVQKEFIRFY